MDIQGLGYVGIRAKSLEDWTSFGTRFLGMQLVERSAKSLALRMDERKQRVVVSEDGGEGVAFFGWEVADAAGTDCTVGRATKERRPGGRPEAVLENQYYSIACVKMSPSKRTADKR